MKNRKLCPRCLKKRPLDQFKPRPNGSVSYCYSCELGYYREYNARRYASPEAREAELARGREKYARVVKAQRMERKRRLIEMMGGCCVFCGYHKSAAALDFDHLHNGKEARTSSRQPNPDKYRTISHLLASNAPDAFEAAVKEAKKCRLVCSNCHRERTYPGNEL